MMYDQDLAARIDHTVLKATTNGNAIDQLCAEAKQYGFAAVCVPPYYVEKAVVNLKDSEVKVCSVVGFPLGYSTTKTKMVEAKMMLETGAEEVDVVINLAMVKNWDWRPMMQEMKALAKLCHQYNALLKVIIETALLTDEEIIAVCKILSGCDVDFVKTSTGFSTAGATIHHIQLMRANLPDNIRIKASGGIRTRAFAQELVAAGADRLGCSQGIAIVTDTSDNTETNKKGY